MKHSYQYAGLQNVHQLGMLVDECVSRLHSLAYVEERLMLLQAAHIVSCPEWDVKILLGRLQYEDSQHADQLKNRLTELRVSKSKAYKAPNDALPLLFDEAMYAANTAELLAALVHLFKPAVIRAYRAYLAQTNGLADAPTVRLLKMALAEEEEALCLLEAAYQELVKTPDQQAAAAWVESLRGLLAAAGGVDGTEPVSPELLRPVRAAQPYTLPRQFARDDTYPLIWDFVHVPNQNVAERLAQMMATRLAEVTAAEGLAYVLCETPDQPWSFYTDIARHLWDEIRHTLFGEVAAEDVFGRRSAMPLRQFDADSVVQMTPLEIYAMLGIGVEAALMKYPPGKREEFEFCRDMAHYPLMTTLQDFDWADEVLHVNIARRQLKEWFEGSQDELLKLAEQGVDLRAQMRHHQPPQPLPAVSHKLAQLGREPHNG